MCTGARVERWRDLWRALAQVERLGSRRGRCGVQLTHTADTVQNSIGPEAHPQKAE